MTVDLTANACAYRHRTYRRRAVLGGLLLAVIVLMILSLCAGADGVNGRILLNGLRRDTTNAALILWHIRVPRTVAAFLAGSGLAMAGGVMQTLLRNPMASPSTLGVSQAAVFGANLAFIVFQAELFGSPESAPAPWLRGCSAAATAFMVAMLDIALILCLVRKATRSSETIVLAGIAIGAAFAAGTTLLQTFAPDTELAAAVFWTFGDLSRISQPQLLVLGATVTLAASVFFASRWSYNAVEAGETYALTLGLNLRRLRISSLMCAAFICAVTVACAGIIGFVGLVAPQLVRRFAGSDHGFLIPAAALTGAALLLLADILARIALTGAELPVGAITSLFGVPIFLTLLLTSRETRTA